MLPWLIMAAASVLANKQKQDQAYRDIYQQQLNKSAQRLGGGAYLNSDLYDESRQAGQMSADYGPLLSLIGKVTDSSDDDDLKKKGVMPRSGVRLKLEDF